MEKGKIEFITNEDLKKIINEYEKYVKNNLLGKKLEFDEGYSSKYINLIAKTLGKNMLLQQKIDKAIEYMEHYIEVEDASINERIKIEFEYVIDILRGEKDENN